MEPARAGAAGLLAAAFSAGLHIWSITDFYLAGIALEITGAAILAKGLFLSPREIAGMVELYPGPDLTEAEERCRNRVDAGFGLGYLLAGFVLQAIGYGAEVAGAHTATGADRLAAALALSAAASGVAWLVWYRLKGGRVRKLADEVLVDLRRRAAERGD